MLNKKEKIAAKIERKGKKMLLTITDEDSHTFTMKGLN